MTRKEAYRILGLTSGKAAEDETTLSEIKTRYRSLMRLVHPDVREASGTPYPYSASEIIHAYSFLKQDFVDPSNELKNRKDRSFSKRQSTMQTWDAPVNPSAYTERDILHYAEDSSGNRIGTFSIARGKYVWKIEEDFPLFLLSIYQCSRELLEDIDSALKRPEDPAFLKTIQAELSYLLAQQFIDGQGILEHLAKEVASKAADARTFLIPSMLETSDKTAAIKPGDALYPSRLLKHRLYLKDRAGTELGYLSFMDDRLYYVIIPLFEQRRVLVRIQADDFLSGSERNRRFSGYQRLRLWIRFRDDPIFGTPENLNLQIQHLLEQYRAKSAFS